MVTIALHPSGDPSHRGWGPGWPNGQAHEMVTLTWSNGVFPAGGVRHEIHDLVLLLGNETIRRGYLPHAGWCWGYSNRPIGGTDPPVASNHSWGLAVDINAPTNPRGHLLRTDMPGWMPDLWNAYGFRWGGDYPDPIQKDAMHYEFMGTPAQALVATAEARAAFAPKPPKPEPAPEPTPPVPMEHHQENPMYVIVAADTTKVYILTPDLKTAIHQSAASAQNCRTGGGTFYRIEPADWARLLANGLVVHE